MDSEAGIRTSEEPDLGGPRQKLEAVEDAAAALAGAVAAERRARDVHDRAVRAAVKAGVRPSRVAEAAGISPGRVTHLTLAPKG